ncbi:MAG: alpha-glucan family phosphorylase [Deltaproteobacteria bacterium]|nr:alpha-glucan family phosphorylase [Deltaproteobacteria bacterium]
MSRKTTGGANGPNDGSRDLAHAIAELAHQVPAALAPLATVAYDYRWTWEPRAGALFEALDPATWRRTANPRYVVEVASPRRLDELAARPEYVAEVRVVGDAILAGAAAPTDAKPVAYFCSEFAIHAGLPIYGGGLGVLAGDLLKAAADAAAPLVGVGLAYRQGYFQQRLDPAGWQHEYWIDCAFDRLPMVRVTDRDGGALTVTVPIRGRDVHAQIWRLDLAHVRLYLLDTDLADNEPIDRWITARLYVGDRHTRLTQYAMLGIGGVRALAALGIEPALVHLNEGHAAFGSYERVAAWTRGGASFDDALAAVRAATVFTTHTPVPAGNEAYGVDEVEVVLGGYFDGIAAPRERLHDLARVRPGDASEGLGITPLALRTSRAANGVSRLHGAVARAMWRPLWSERAADDVPIGHVTNGVHAGTWMAPAMQALLDRHLGADWRRWRADDAGWDAIAAIPDADLWSVRSGLRAALVEYARTRSVQDRLSRGEAPEYVAQAAEVFDADVLTIGFARRVATYKRLHLLARYPERNLRLLADDAMPIQLVIAGKAHPQDQDAKNTLHAIFGAKAIPNVGRRVVYLENYDLAMALRLVSGVDVWLNLPRPPLEASGTSGMKVAMNGGLNVSMLDGWWAEAFDGENGWGIDSPEGDHQAQDDRDAAAVLDLVEREVRPLFYERGADGLPTRWLARVKHALRTLVPRFTAARMLREYAERMYAAAH